MSAMQPFVTSLSSFTPKDPGRDASILVTGFADWTSGTATLAGRHHVRRNPSGRMLLNQDWATLPDRPTDFSGPLPRHLRKVLPDVDWRFAVLPVQWGIEGKLSPIDATGIVSLGLHGRLKSNQLIIETGAFNRRFGIDALGGPPEHDHAWTSSAPRAWTRKQLEKIQEAVGRVSSPLEIQFQVPRASNAYLCNSVFSEALRLKNCCQAVFLHVPQLTNAELEPYAKSLAELIGAMTIRWLADE